VPGAAAGSIPLEPTTRGKPPIAAAGSVPPEPPMRVEARGTRDDLDPAQVARRASGSAPPLEVMSGELFEAQPPSAEAARRYAGLEHDAESDPELPKERETELDLHLAAAAALEAVRNKQAEPAGGARVALPEHETQLGGPSAMGTPAPKKTQPSAFAPTAALGELTADAPGESPLGPFDELPEGTLLAGRYHVTELVGHGGMGAVYAAHDDDLDEDVALKVLRFELGRDADFQRRLKAEVRLARHVSHPNVCRVHDIGVDDDLVFVTMELVRGHTLRERLAETIAGRAAPLELAQIVDIIVQIGSALAAAHRAGVIHRDVKPDNIILSGGRAVLTDFGVASMAIDRKHSIVGTPAYLAPEVLRAEVFDHRVDIYAVSCVAYELIAGSPPFAARTLDAAMKLARERPLVSGSARHVRDACGARRARSRALARARLRSAPAPADGGAPHGFVRARRAGRPAVAAGAGPASGAAVDTGLDHAGTARAPYRAARGDRARLERESRPPRHRARRAHHRRRWRYADPRQQRRDHRAVRRDALPRRRRRPRGARGARDRTQVRRPRRARHHPHPAQARR
jgi:serine/threonine-protein kinase